MANYGAIKTLMTMLQSAQSIAIEGITLQYGEELIAANDAATPRVTLVPTTGTYYKNTVGYAKDADPNLDMQWALNQLIELWCWGFDPTPGATTIDHCNATENIRAAMLQAFWDQRAVINADGDSVGGVDFEPVSERWERMGDGVNRFGRALVMTIACDVTIGYLAPQEVTLDEVTIDSVTVEPIG